MPNWLSDAWNAANTPLVPKSAIQGMQNSLEEPHLDQSPLMAGIKGFGSGALEGLRGLTSPVQLAGIASLAGGAGIGALGKAASAAGDVIQPVSEAVEAARAANAFRNITPEVVEAAPAVKQVMPSMQDAMDLGGLLKHNLAKVPQAGSKALGGAMEGLQGALTGGAAPAAEMVAPGSEGLFNAERAAQGAGKLFQRYGPQLPDKFNFAKPPILGQ